MGDEGRQYKSKTRRSIAGHLAKCVNFGRTALTTTRVARYVVLVVRCFCKIYRNIANENRVNNNAQNIHTRVYYIVVRSFVLYYTAKHNVYSAVLYTHLCNYLFSQWAVYTGAQTRVPVNACIIRVYNINNCRGGYQS